MTDQSTWSSTPFKKDELVTAQIHRELLKVIRNQVIKLVKGKNMKFEEAKDLIRYMLTKEENRITAAEAFQHPWFEICRRIEMD